MKNQLETEELVIEDNLNPSISFKKIYFSLINNKLIIFLGILLGIFPALYINFTTEEKWEGEFEIVLDEFSKSKINLQDIFQNNNFKIEQNAGTAINTEVGILKSSSVLMNIYEYVQNEKTKYNSKYSPTSFNGWKSGLDIKLVNGTSILKIKYKDSNKELILPVLNKISDTYQKYSLKNDKLNLDLENKFYKEQIAFYKKKSNLSLDKAKSYSDKYDLDIIQKFSDNNSGYPNLTIGIEERSKNAKNKIRLINELITNLKASRNDPEKIVFIASNLGAETSSSTSNILNPIFNQIQQINVKLNNYLNIYLRNDPIIKELELNRSQLIDTLYTNLIGALNAEIDKSNAIIQSSKRPEGVLVKYSQLNSEANRDSNILFNLENQYRLIMLQRAKEGNPWQLITNPTVKPQSIMPRKSRNIKIGLLLGIFSGMILAIAKQKSKGLILSSKDLNKIVSWPLIANIELLNSKDFKDYIDAISAQFNKSEKKLLIYPVTPMEFEQKNILIKNLKESKFKNLEFQDDFKNLKNYTDILLLINLGITSEEDIIKLDRKIALLEITIFGCIIIEDEMRRKL